MFNFVVSFKNKRINVLFLFDSGFPGTVYLAPNVIECMLEISPQKIPLMSIGEFDVDDIQYSSGQCEGINLIGTGFIIKYKLSILLHATGATIYNNNENNNNSNHI